VTVLADQRFFRKRVRKDSRFAGGAAGAGFSSVSVLTLFPLPERR
jgi:hypothetical protein